MVSESRAARLLTQRPVDVSSLCHSVRAVSREHLGQEMVDGQHVRW